MKTTKFEDVHRQISIRYDLRTIYDGVSTAILCIYIRYMYMMVVFNNFQTPKWFPTVLVLFSSMYILLHDDNKSEVRSEPCPANWFPTVLHDKQVGLLSSSSPSRASPSHWLLLQASALLLPVSAKRILRGSDFRQAAQGDSYRAQVQQ